MQNLTVPYRTPERPKPLRMSPFDCTARRATPRRRTGRVTPRARKQIQAKQPKHGLCGKNVWKGSRLLSPLHGLQGLRSLRQTRPTPCRQLNSWDLQTFGNHQSSGAQIKSRCSACNPANAYQHLVLCVSVMGFLGQSLQAMLMQEGSKMSLEVRSSFPPI